MREQSRRSFLVRSAVGFAAVGSPASWPAACDRTGDEHSEVVGLQAIRAGPDQEHRAPADREGDRGAGGVLAGSSGEETWSG